MNEFVNHFTAVRLRVVGAGNLQSTLKSYSDVSSYPLANIVMVAATERTPTILANFVNQTARLKIETNEIDEIFNVSQIIVYIKPIATGFPQ